MEKKNITLKNYVPSKLRAILSEKEIKSTHMDYVNKYNGKLPSIQPQFRPISKKS